MNFTKSYYIWTLCLLLCHILPVAARHVIELLARIEALANADGFEVSAPKVLEEVVVCT